MGGRDGMLWPYILARCPSVRAWLRASMGVWMRRKEQIVRELLKLKVGINSFLILHIFDFIMIELTENNTHGKNLHPGTIINKVTQSSDGGLRNQRRLFT